MSGSGIFKQEEKIQAEAQFTALCKHGYADVKYVVMYAMIVNEISLYKFGSTWRKAFAEFISKKYNIMPLWEAVQMIIANSVNDAFVNGNSQDQALAVEIQRKMMQIFKFLRKH